MDKMDKDKMTIYHWASKTLSDYSDGDIFVMAESVEKAREKIIAYLNRVIIDSAENCSSQNGLFVWDEEGEIKIRNGILEDISKEPGNESDIHFVYGGG
jgi:hypothetical protein